MNRSWRHDLLGWWATLLVFAPIIAALVVFGNYPNVWTFIAAFMVVGMRQYAMLLLGHETWHLSLFRSRRLNRQVGAWLCFYPLFNRYDALRIAHLEHHRKSGQDDDPYTYFWKYRSDERKAFLRQVLSLAGGLIFARTVLQTIAKLVRGDRASPAPPSTRVRPTSPHKPPELAVDRLELVAVALTQMTILLAFSVTLGWEWYFALWAAPAVTLAVTMDYIRNWAEHRHGALIIYRCNLIERLLFAPLHFNLHAVHHVYPGEPWYRLPVMERQALDRTRGIQVYTSYVGELVRYLRGSRHLPNSPSTPSSS